MTEPHFFVAHPSVQFNRAQRYVNRLRDGYQGREFTRNGENVEWEDDMYSTFIHIHHIRDWFVDSELKKEAKKYTYENFHLKRCAWIANLWKHSEVLPSVPARVGRLPTFLTITASNVPSLDKPPTQRYPFVFEFSGNHTETFESLELAEGGLQAWETFITKAISDGRIAALG